MVSKSRPYVGVSGVYSAEEARNVASLMHGSGFTMQAGHVPMMGFQVSWRSLDFGFSEGNNRVPRLDSLPQILEAISGEVFPTIHYYTKRPDRLVQEIERVTGILERSTLLKVLLSMRVLEDMKVQNSMSSPVLAIERVLEYESIYDSGLVGGVQINGAFPEPDSVEELRNSYPSLKLALQVNPGTMEIETMAKTLAGYYKGLDYVLFDSSGGRGLELDVGRIAAAYRALKDSGSEAGVVFAGGLAGGNVTHKIKLLAEAIGERGFSIDAEGGLRDRVGEGYGNDMLNMDKVASYLRGASEALLG